MERTQIQFLKNETFPPRTNTKYVNDKLFRVISYKQRECLMVLDCKIDATAVYKNCFGFYRNIYFAEK